MSQIKGTSLVTISGILYGGLAYFGTLLIQQNFNIASMLFWRFLFAAIWILFSAIVIRKNIFHFTTSKSDFFKTMIFGILTYMGSSFFYFLATFYISTGIAMVIFFSYPIFVALLAWLFSGWKISKHAVFSLLALMMGLFLLKDNGNESLNLIGISYAMLGGICYALYVFGNKDSAKNINSSLQTFIICAGNAVVFAILASVYGELMVPASSNKWLCAIGLGIIATALPIQFLLDGLKYISSIKASILSVLEPIVTLLVGIFLLNETVSLMQTLGIVTVLIGAIFIQFEKDSLYTHEQRKYET